MKDWLIHLGDALSQFFNVLLFNGDPNYSISGDAYRFKRVWMMKLIDKVFGAGHCESAYANDVAKAQALVHEYENQSGRH